MYDFFDEMVGMSAVLGLSVAEASKLPEVQFSRACTLVRTTLQSRGVPVELEPVPDITEQMDKATDRLRKRFPDRKTFSFDEVMKEASHG